MDYQLLAPNEYPVVQDVKPKQLYLPALTGIRAIAAWMVFFHHFNPFTTNSIPWRLVSQWYTGVALFFVLSGFLICFRYINRLELSVRWARKYIQNRVARIYPMYLLVTCIVFAMTFYTKEYGRSSAGTVNTLADTWLAFGLNVTFLRGFFSEFVFTGVVQGWTLTVEECFYFLAPFLLIGIRKQTAWLFLYAILLIGTGCLLVSLPAPFHPYGFFSSYALMFETTFFGRCVEFLSGIYLAIVLLKQKSITFRWPVFTALGVLWIFGSMVAMAVVDVPGTQSGFTLAARICLNNLVLVPGICFLFYGLIKETSIVRWILESKVFDLLGKSSYIFYLIHMGVVSKLLDSYVTDKTLIKFVIINIISIILYKLVEHPLQRRLAAKK